MLLLAIYKEISRERERENVTSLEALFLID